MVITIGHKGAAGPCSENTIGSFLHALDLGADMVELDVHICRTGEPVVIHDETVDRTTDGSGRISSMGLKEIRRLDAGGGEKVPSLDEVIGLLKGRCALNIELKGPSTAGPVGELLRHHNVGEEEVIVSSFHPTELYDLRNSYPEYRTGFLVEDDLREAVDFIIELGGYSIHPSFELVSSDLIFACGENDLKVIVWTVNREEDIRKMLELGVDGIITDHPGLVP